MADQDAIICFVSFHCLTAQQIGIIPQILFSQITFIQVKQRFEPFHEGRYLFQEENYTIFLIKTKIRKRQ